MSEPTSHQTPKPHQCRHIFTDGHQCGSPALRGEKLCFYHHACRRPAVHQLVHGLTFIALPAPDDFHAIQRGLAEVLRLSAGHRIEPRHAAVLLRGLSIASANLARIARQAKNAPPLTDLVQNFVHDPILGILAPEPEAEAIADSEAQPLPDYVPVTTPEPTLTYITTPEADAENTARWDKAVQELNDYKRAHPRRPNPAPTPHQPAATIQVQTYPPSNQDFGLYEKTTFAPLAVLPEENPRLPYAQRSERTESISSALIGVKCFVPSYAPPSADSTPAAAGRSPA